MNRLLVRSRPVTRFLSLGAAAALVVATLSCGSDTAPTTPSTSKTWDVSTFGESFLPFSQTISAGDSVRWSFSVAADNFGHNVHFTAAPGAPPSILQEQRSGTKTLGFTTKGTFDYVCDLHGGMTGEIIVQ